MQCAPSPHSQQYVETERFTRSVWLVLLDFGVLLGPRLSFDERTSQFGL